MADLLFWPALIALRGGGVRVLGDAPRPGAAGARDVGRAARLARSRPALLARAGRADRRLPVGELGRARSTSSSGSSCRRYLIWGCRRRYRLLGLAVMPLAAVLLLVARARRRHRDRRAQSHYGEPLPDPPRRLRARGVRRVHARRGAGGALPARGAAAAAALVADFLRLQLPSLATLERARPRGRSRLAAALTLGIAIGIVRLVRDGGGVDALMAATILTWLVYGRVRCAPALAGWAGRRAAISRSPASRS